MVHYETEGRVAIIRIDRPNARNAIDNETALALKEKWERFENSEETVGILTGSDDVFSAGADLKKMDLEDRPEGYLGFSRTMVSKPTIAAIEGYCVAGGLEMALWCDMRVAAESSVFGCYERRFGVPLVDGGTQRLPRIIGLGRAMDMILTGRTVESEEALEWGLINRLTEVGKALDKAIELGQKLAEFPQTTLRSDREAVYKGFGRSIEDGLQIERELGNESMDTALDGAQRFAEGEGRHGHGT